MILEVLTPSAVGVATVGGFAVGWLLLAEAIRDPRYGTGAAAGTYARLIGGMGILIGGVFWSGQIVSSAVDGDPAWPRAAARYVVWLIFSVAVGVGVYVGLRR